MAKRKREYLLLLDRAVPALEQAVDSFNRVVSSYKAESCLILLCNAWELLAKSVLVKKHHSIAGNAEGTTISAEVAIHRLAEQGILDQNQEWCLQQVISLRNHAVHNVLPSVPKEILHHLVFFSCKFFRGVLGSVFPSHVKSLPADFLSVSFDDMTTYADKVQKLVARIRRNDQSRKLVWLLERGVRFDGTQYISQAEFDAQYHRRKKILPHLGLNSFLKGVDMVRIVAVQAPRNFTADISLRKGSRADSTLPVVIKKTNVEEDYPFFTREIADRVGKNANFTATTVKFLGLKGNSQFHQAVRASKTGVIHRYSQAAADHIAAYLRDNPAFNPYREIKRQRSANP